MSAEDKDAKANGNGNVENKANISNSKPEPGKQKCATKFLEKFEERERERLKLLEQDKSQGKNEGQDDQEQNLGQNQDQNAGEKRKAEDEVQNEKKKSKSKSDAIDGNEKSSQEIDDDGLKVVVDHKIQKSSGSGVSQVENDGKEQDREIITLGMSEPSPASIFSRIFSWASRSLSYKYSQKVGDWVLNIQNISGLGISMRIFETPGGLRIRIAGRCQNQKTSFSDGHYYFQVEVIDGKNVNEILLKIPKAVPTEAGEVAITQDGECVELLATPFTCTK